jgi:hypothetical protein
LATPLWPLVTEQVWVGPEGWLVTETEYVAPAATAGARVNVVELAATVAWAPLILSVTTNPEPVSGPLIVPPSV